jgi:hypothetical protein
MRPFRFPTSSAAAAAASTAASATAFSAHAQLVASRAAFLGKLFGGGSKKTDDSASAEGDGDAAPKRKLPTNPLGLAKDMYQVTKAAKEMSNAVNAAKGKGGVDAFAESQLAQFRSLLELQKQMATQAGGDKGNPSALDQKKMAQMMEQSSALFEKMILPMEQQITRKSRGDAAAASGPTPAQIAAAAAAGHKKFPQQETSTSSDTGSGAASSSSSSSATATAQQDGGSNNSGLPPEIAELFAELRAMRTKKNEYRDKYRAADQELSGTKQQLAKAQAHEADLRKRLAAAEAKSNEQHARNLELDDAKDQLSAQVKKLHAELSRAQPAVAASAQAQQRQVEQELAKTRKREAELGNEVVRLERKLRRLRRHSPMGDVSDLLAELSRLGTETNVPFGAGDMESAFGGSSNDARSEEDLLDAAADQQLALESGGHLRHEFRAGVADDAFDACREKYERIVTMRFAEDSREVGVSDAVARVALEVLRARLPCALLDCVLVVGSQAAVDEIRALAERHNSSGNNSRGAGGGGGGESGGSGSRWTVTAEQNAGLQSFTVTVAESSDVASDQIVLGPYGYLACTFALRKQQQGGGGGGAALLPSAVYPVASPALLANAKRVQILTDRARSSKPGGQASNVGETKITHRLLIDGGLFASAFSQDTRSAMFNTGTAMDRLLKERVPAVNQRLRGSVKPLVGKDAGANAITTAAPSLATCLGSIAEDADAARAAAVRFVLLQTSGIAPASEEQQQKK